ncbi:sulfoxide reductase heme-binding subunit YedZ [Roseovarius pacificus]|uniref:Protein-methionine-sulfoxide reductase heme-binding subunit MsrQ n=1 Tax=Roseovarius pacificus TaxID=337701 RepID=A0A1M7G3U5_9RHOB|nr:protein-methionine-sulfoxide reductase heme-binding subunit MsrQ [Roseovarius pacificus]GGO59603.1 protein-methionine-sulfoxide reductase heme-binding subunit MsrQ [Roseovarius pacificus]SHM11052.1 sulfoxide reductase heme-binding subunit YedZ [Roseovarius pacificus]
MIADRLNRLARKVPAAVLYVLGLVQALWLFYLGATGGLGVEPIKALEHELGEIALQLIIAGLCITPLRRFAGINLLKFRRALGLMAFFFVTLHLLVWLVLDVQIPALIWADILKRPYITVGMLAFALMIPLAMTSNGWSVRRLGARWRKLHRLTYAVAVLGGIHFLWLVKGFQMEPILYLAAIVQLLALRVRPVRRKQAA